MGESGGHVWKIATSFNFIVFLKKRVTLQSYPP